MTAPHPVLDRYYRTHAERPAFVRALVDATAGSYDTVCRVMSLGSGQWYRRKALVRAGLARDMKLLDVATGTGLVARAAIPVLGPDAVVGLDASGGMLREARKAFGGVLVQGRAEALPFADGQFDAVTIGYALRHLADLSTVFAECRRVLRAGGRLLVLEITRPRSAAARCAIRIHLRWLLPLLVRRPGRGAGIALLTRYYWDTIDACVPPAAILQALDDAGFTPVTHTMSGGCLSEYVAIKPRPPRNRV